MGRPPISSFEKQLRNEISNNLKSITRGMTQAQISELTGIPTSTLSGYFAKRSTIKEENLTKIAKAFNVDKADIDPRHSRNYDFIDLKKEIVDELNEAKKGITGDDFAKLAKKANSMGIGLSSMTTDRGNSITALYHDAHDYNYFDANISAGAPSTIEAFDEDHVEQIAIPDMLMGKYAGCSEIFFTSINGESMNNVIPNGSMVAVKKIDSVYDLENNDIVVFSNDNEFSIKRFINDKTNERIIFRPDSNDISFTDVVVSYTEAESLVVYGKVIVYVVQV